MTLPELRSALARFGLDLALPLPIAEYDRIVPPAWQASLAAPGARGVLVVGNGGRALWDALQRAPEARLARDPLDTYTQRALRESARSLDPPAPFALYTERREGSYLPMVALARRAGFGAPGRVGVLIHPRYGPWVGVRAVLYLPFAPDFREPEPFDPCTGCPAPCMSACRGGVVHAGGVDVEGCFRTRMLDSACRWRCDARLACVVGPEHAYPPDQFRHHQRIRWRPAVLGRAARVLAKFALRRP